MQSRCAKHLFEGAEDRCGKCGLEFCGECLVYAFGPKKPPMCIPCAVAAAGIRASAGNRPTLNKNEMKRVQKERQSAFKRFRRDRKTQPADLPTTPAPVDPTPVAPLPPTEPLLPAASPAFSQIPEPEPIAPAPQPVAEQLPPPAYSDEPFQTEPAYVDPSPSTLPISGR
jgi:hypothetical protein